MLYGVKINNIHHGTVLSFLFKDYENFHRFQFLTIKTQFIILSEDVFFCQGKDYCKGEINMAACSDLRLTDSLVFTTMEAKGMKGEY